MVNLLEIFNNVELHDQLGISYRGYAFKFQGALDKKIDEIGGFVSYVISLISLDGDIILELEITERELKDLSLDREGKVTVRGHNLQFIKI